MLPLENGELAKAPPRIRPDRRRIEPLECLAIERNARGGVRQEIAEPAGLARRERLGVVTLPRPELGMKRAHGHALGLPGDGIDHPRRDQPPKPYHRESFWK